MKLDLDPMVRFSNLTKRSKRDVLFVVIGKSEGYILKYILYVSIFRE